MLELVKRLQDWNDWRRLNGIWSTVKWLGIRVALRLGFDEPQSWRVRPRQVQHPLTVRLRASSDMSVFSQIFVEEEYSCVRGLENVSTILDLGANVGYSSAYFLSCFRNARLIAVEPDSGNLSFCRTNLARYGNRAMVLHGAAWGERTRLCLSRGTFGDGREWATQVCEQTDKLAADIEAWDVGSLIELGGGRDVDLLKVDIERAEMSVFSESCQAWLHRVRNICIELHGPDCSEQFFNALAGFDFDLSVHGELTLCSNLRRKTYASRGSAA